MTEKVFSEYWGEVEKLKALPQKAIQQLSSSLSADTKKKLMKLSPEEALELMKVAIDQINQGSVESIDGLVRRSL